MDTNRYTPELIVRENLTFSIPLYQRLFAWGEKQVIGLMMDLFEHFKKGEKPYYLGMLSCIANKGHYDLIDGQQRFTVMTLLGIVLKEYDGDTGQWVTFLNGGKRINFVARTKDKEYLSARIAGDASVPDKNIKMEAAIEAIKSFMENPKYFSNSEDRRIYSARVFKYLSFYFSSLPSEYLSDPSSLNKYFEAMNAHGKSLEQHEILKVDLMKGEPNKEYLTRIWNAVSEMGRPIIKKSNEEDTIDVYRRSYQSAIQCCRRGAFKQAFEYCESSYDTEDNDTIEAIKPKKPDYSKSIQFQDDIADRSVVSFPEFLLLVLDINQSLSGKYSFYRKDLITAFKENTVPDVNSFYNDLLYCRLLLDYYVITKEDGKTGNKYDILFRCSYDDDSAKQIESVVQYQSMLYVSQTPIYEWLKPLIMHLREKCPESNAEVLGWLKDTDDTYRDLPKSVGELSYKDVDRYWFWRLDYYLWERQDDYFKDAEEKEVVNEYVFRANRSIEHLHPQHQEHNAEWEDSDVHSFGNLAMISQSFNSEQSDDPVTVKFARILDQASNHNLQSIKMYKMYLEAEKTPGGWTVEKMHKHRDEMYELLKSSYVR